MVNIYLRQLIEAGLDLLRLREELERQRTQAVQEGRCVAPLHGLLVAAAVVDVLAHEDDKRLQQLGLVDGVRAGCMDGVGGHGG